MNATTTTTTTTTQNRTALGTTTVRTLLVAATLLVIAAGATPAHAAQDIFTGAAAEAILAQLRATGGARTVVGQVQDLSGNVESVQYRDVLSVDGTARGNDGRLAVVVTLGQEQAVRRSPVYAYPIYYFNPQANRWVQYATTEDRTQAEQTINWIRTTYRLQTHCQPQVSRYTFNWPAAVRAGGRQTAGTTTTPNTGGNATTAGGPGLLGVPMGGM